MTNLEKAKILRQNFGVYGYGNFDVTTEEVAEILSILSKEDATIKLKELYDRLEKLRMG